MGDPFDYYACFTCYPNVTNKLKDIPLVTQNKYKGFHLILNSRKHYIKCALPKIKLAPHEFKVHVKC